MPTQMASQYCPSIPQPRRPPDREVMEYTGPQGDTVLKAGDLGEPLPYPEHVAK